MEYPSIIRQERFADSIVHFLGIVTVSVSSICLMVGTALHSSIGLIVACTVYSLSLMASFISSASYHLLPTSEWRDFLRRLDHIAIYGLIAGTFTPLLVRVDSTWGYYVLAAVWLFAILAMVYKIVGKEVEPKWSLASYLALGWMAVIVFPDLITRLPSFAVATLVTGGLFYTCGTYFYVKEVQPYRNAIWHSFVFIGTIFCFGSIWITVFWQ